MSQTLNDLDIRAAVEDLFAPDRSEEIAFWARLAVQYGRNVLVAMCGSGEVACGLAERDLIVTGIDRAGSLLSSALGRRETLPHEAAQRVSFNEADTKKPRVVEDEFDFALIGGGGFGHLLSRRAQRGILGAVCNALRLGGGVGMELMSVSGAESQSRAPEARRLKPTRKPPSGIKLEKISRRSYDPAQRRLTLHETVMAEGDGVERRFECESEVQAFELEEAASLLRESGFEEFSAYCDYAATPYSAGCPKLIVVAEKPIYKAESGHGDQEGQRAP